MIMMEREREILMEQSRMKHTKDNITNQVIEDLKARAECGYKKYNTTLGENNKDNYMNHLYEELLDAAQYIKKEQSIIPDIQNLIEQYSNNMELGAKIREIYGKK
jgi:HSP90 family molecular chaperone